MMKKMISLLALTTLFVMPMAEAKDVKNQDKAPILLSYCNHFGTGVSFSFQSCVNSNFSAISRVLGGMSFHCMNIGSEVDYSFVSCVQSNFRDVERKLDNRVWLQTCMNFDRATLDFSFVSCVNSNFNTIEREIRNNRQ